eukprot:1616899-Amphidinium_carterae.1
MRAYPSTKIFVELTIPEEAETVTVPRFLTQLSFGQPVHMVTEGPQLQVPNTNIKITIAMDEALYPEMSGELLSGWMAQILEPQAWDVLAMRRTSAVLQVARELSEKVLRASGRDGLYAKTHMDEQQHVHILWLPAGTSHAEAYGKVLSTPHIQGLAKSAYNHVQIYGLRFATQEQMDTWAQAHQLESPHPAPKFCIQGLQRPSTILELHDMLAPLGYAVEDLVCSDATHTVFTASQ